MPSSGGSARAVSIFASPSSRVVLRLLDEARLPVADLAGQPMHNFFGCGTPDDPRGVIGLEVHGGDALLRSLVVHPAARGQGCAGALVARAERHALEQGVRRIYLLTTTAADFFAHLGYKRVDRHEEVAMASAKQKAAARRNIRKDAKRRKHR